jgi:16S rRNA (guanine527-N7)-methyltransferase
MTAAQVLAPYAEFLSRPFEDVARDLESFAALLLKWNQTQNLVSRETAHEVWPRHIADSLQVLKLLRSSDQRLLDLGSGGGFPAIPLAIASGAVRQFTLAEPIAKKASFLRTASRELDLGLRVEARRSTDLDPADVGPIDVVTSRALAPLPVLLGFAAPFFGPATRAILHKGREYVDEVAESRAAWQFDVVVHASDTDPGGVLLEISNLRLK